MMFPGWIPPPTPSDDDRSDDDREREARRRDARGVPTSYEPSVEDRAEFNRLMDVGAPRQDDLSQGEPAGPPSETDSHATPAQTPAAPSIPPPASGPLDPARLAAGLLEAQSPSLGTGTASLRDPDSKPVQGDGARPTDAPAHGHGHAQRRHSEGPGDPATPGAAILGTLQAHTEPPPVPPSDDSAGGRLEALIREVAQSVAASAPAASAGATVRLELKAEVLPETAIDLSLKNGELLVVLTTGSAEVEQMLSGRLGVLRDRLAATVDGRPVRVELARAGGLRFGPPPAAPGDPTEGGR